MSIGDAMLETFKRRYRRRIAYLEATNAEQRHEFLISTKQQSAEALQAAQEISRLREELNTQDGTIAELKAERDRWLDAATKRQLELNKMQRYEQTHLENLGLLRDQLHAEKTSDHPELVLAQINQELTAERDAAKKALQDLKPGTWSDNAWSAVCELLVKQETLIPHIEGERDRLREAFEEIENWSRAYPLGVFPEPDMAKAHEALVAAGMTLDAVSASNMRHAITRVMQIAQDALMSSGSQLPMGANR